MLNDDNASGTIAENADAGCAARVDERRMRIEVIMSDDGDQKGFWSSVPGMLTGVAAVLSALSGLYIAVSGRGPSRPADQPAAVAVTAPGKPDAAPAAVKAEVRQPADTFVLTAVINDPDGFTNVRAAAGASGAVIARVNNGEQFHTYPQDGTWWQVRTQDGRVGYMHASRIRIVPAR